MASSGPNASSSAASDDIALTGGQLLSLEKKVADKTDWATDKDKRESARTAIQGFESGIKRIIDRTPVPVIPMALSGLWGSFFSRKGGPAMTKPFRRGLLSRITLSIAPAVPASGVLAEGLQAQVLALRGDER